MAGKKQKDTHYCELCRDEFVDMKSHNSSQAHTQISDAYAEILEIADRSFVPLLAQFDFNINSQEIIDFITIFRKPRFNHYSKLLFQTLKTEHEAKLKLKSIGSHHL